MKCAIILAGFQRFDKGTQDALFSKQKLIALPDEIYSQVFLAP
jgi:hypothetical protein